MDPFREFFVGRNPALPLLDHRSITELDVRQVPARWPKPLSGDPWRTQGFWHS
jgi:hypothetical protein